MIQRFLLLLSLVWLLVTPDRLYAQQAGNDRANQIFQSVSQTLKKNSFIGNTLFNDAFSGKLFKLYLNSLDKDHLIFLQTDIDYLKKYALSLDDELNGGTPQFYTEVLKRYKTRVDEFEHNCQVILKEPFNLTNVETIDLKTLSQNYPANGAAQKSKLGKYLKYEVLKTMKMLQKNANTNIAQLQKQARTLVSEKYANSCAKIKRGLSTDDFLSAYLKQVCLTVDPHTNYNSSKEVAVANARVKGKLCGVGMQLEEKNGYFSVASLTKDGTALRSGKIKNGDVLVAIQEPGAAIENIGGWELWDVIQHITGEEDSEVILFFNDAKGEKFPVKLKRKEIKNSAVAVRSFIIKKEDYKTGYIVIPQFDVQVTSDLQGELLTLMKNGVDGIVIDLRSNPGGRQDEVVKCAGLFIPKGPIAQNIYKGVPKPEVMDDQDPTMYYKGPLAILVSERSASASELFSSCLQDYNRAIIIGLPTLGKGTSYMSYPVSVEGASDEEIRNDKYGRLNITGSKYYRITGASVQLTGVIPDVIVPDYREMPQIRERQRPCALQADTVTAANFPYYNFGYDIPKAKEILNAQVKKDPQFVAIQQAKIRLQKQQAKPIPLSWKKFVAYEKETANLTSEAERISILKNKLIVEVPTNAQQGFRMPGEEEDEEEKAKLNQRWQEYLSKDGQLNLAVKAIKLMQ